MSEREGIPMTLLPPRPGVCPECAVPHAPPEPHDAWSLYYQMRFHGEHGRWPTWEDAMAHCDPETQRVWREELANVLGERLEEANS